MDLIIVLFGLVGGAIALWLIMKVFAFLKKASDVVSSGYTTSLNSLGKVLEVANRGAEKLNKAAHEADEANKIWADKRLLELEESRRETTKKLEQIRNSSENPISSSDGATASLLKSDAVSQNVAEKKTANETQKDNATQSSKTVPIATADVELASNDLTTQLSYEKKIAILDACKNTILIPHNSH